MSLMVKVLFAAKAKSTHHKLALDALPRLTCRDAAGWRDMFLRYHDPYLVGAKAPDDQFKDFKNHVLHVKDGFWGGAPATALMWYGKTVTALRDQNWVDAAYCAGVLSHYVTDPVMPLHTGQSEAEGPVHRPAEWSITKSYETLRDILQKELGGYPRLTVPDSDDWLGDMVRAAATVSHDTYETIIDRYNMALGVDDPPAGLDRELQVRIARLIGLATELFAQVLSHAIEESHQPAPPVDLTLDTLVASLNMPLNWITKKITDVKDRMQIEAMYREFQHTGKVIERLPEDDKLVRELHASEVLGVSAYELDRQPIRRIGALHGKPGSDIGLGAHAFHEPAPIVNPQPESWERPSRRKPVAPQVAVSPRAAANIHSSLPERISSTKVQPVAIVPVVPLVVAPTATPSLPPPLPRPTEFTGIDTSALQPVPTPIPTEEPPVSEVAADSIFADDFQLPPPLPRVIPPTRIAPRLTELPQPREPEAESLPLTSARPADEDSPRYYLDRDRPVVDAPSIGPKTAERLQNVGIETVADLLDADPEAIAAQLDVRHITADTIREWQAQAQLVCDVSGLRGHDAQILVACDIMDHEALSDQNPATLLDRVETFLATSEGERILRGAMRPDLAEVTDWITAARRWPKRQAA